jgi:hypothetical protein
MSAANRLVMSAAMHLYGRQYWRPLDQAAGRPGDSQRRVLAGILCANRDTAFGRAHGFAAIRTPADYARQVPVQHYELLRPYVERQRRLNQPALTAEAPMFYAQTSGSTGEPKYIPITASTFEANRREQKVFSYLQHRACPEAFAGRTLGIMGAAVEGRLDSGHAVGSVSGHLYQSMPGFVRARFVVPPDVSTITDYEMKYLLILRLALETPDISYMGAPNPSSFLRLATLLETHREGLMRSLATGVFDGLDRLDHKVRAAVAGRITAQPARAAALDALPALTFANVWPQIALVTTWTGGSCGIALSSLRTQLPEKARVMELGYQSTEFRGTFALGAETPGGLPPLHHHFFEFVEEEAWDMQRPDFLTLEQLQPGRRYQVVVTTAAGLYRYFMNDLVEVTGRHRETPLLRFIQKGKGVTNLTGEKLYESQVIDAVQCVARDRGVASSFFFMIADESAGGYRLYVESAHATPADDRTFAAAVDTHLGSRNIEYYAKRASGRLAPLTVTWLRAGAGEAYKAASVRAGQREGQYKPVVLQYARELRLSPDALEALKLEASLAGV